VEVFDPASTRVGCQSQGHIATDGPSVIKSWCRAPSCDSRTDTCYCLTAKVLFFVGAVSEERTGLSLLYAVGPCQRSVSRVLVPWDFRPYFTVSHLRLPFSSPPTTRMVTVEVFDPASTQGLSHLLTVSFYNPSVRTPWKTQPMLLTVHVYRAVA
jgi:hypothetical protein